MDYEKKYFKYKTKYLELKNSSEQQILQNNKFKYKWMVEAIILLK